jgi:excisionase family DNA binding protein
MPGPGRFARPSPQEFPSLAQAELNAVLHWAHLQAGRPSSRQLAGLIEHRKLMSPPPSHATVYDAFATVRLPSQQLVNALMRVLGEIGPTREGREVERQAALGWWRRAADAETGGAAGVNDAEPTPPAFLRAGSPLRDVLLLTPEEAAALLGVSAADVHRMAYAGLLPAIKVGKNLRLPEPGVRAYRDAQVSEPAG